MKGKLRPLPPGIAIDGAICFGAPRIANHRISTGIIRRFFLGGVSIAGIVDQYPGLTPEDVENALRFEMQRHLYKRHIELAQKECERVWDKYWAEHPSEKTA